MALSLQQYSACKYKHEIKDNLMKRLDRQRKSSLSIAISNNGDHIPEHLIIEILSWLPVRAVLQFKSVCKFWYTIIKSSHFISKHLENYYNNNNNWRDCLIVQYCITQARELSVYELLVDDKRKRLLSFQSIETPEYRTYMCGPCHGIYLLWDPLSWDGRERSLWNPTLDELKHLPLIDLKPNLPPYMTVSCNEYGFGFDRRTKDYKVIVIQSYRDKRDRDSKSINYPLSVHIYSLKTNSWRYWGDLKKSYYVYENESYVFSNGCYYWIGSLESYGYNYEVMMCFDITLDAYEEFPFPKFEKPPRYGSQLVVYHDSIAFVLVPECGTEFSIWTWSGEVWTQKLSMDVGFQVWGAFAQWWDNMLVFRRAGGHLILCDTATSELWELDDPRQGHGSVNIIVHKESLVSINEIAPTAQLEDDHGEDDHGVDEHSEIFDHFSQWLDEMYGIVEIPV